MKNPENASVRRVEEILCVAAVYFLVGRLSLLLAIPPGYATAIWPAAGIAVAGVLLRGDRIWPGILLGSCAVNVGTNLDASSPSALARSIIVPLAIAIGATLQALTAAHLVRRTTKDATAITGEEDVLRVLAFGGPVASLVNASVSVTTLVVAGILRPSEIAFSWWTWWIGDTIGVVIFAPIVLLWAPGAASVGLRRKILVTVPLACTFALAVVFFVRTSAWEQRRIETAFERRSDEVADALRRDLETNMEVLDFLGGFFSTGAHMSPAELRVFTRRLRSRHPDIETLFWSPYQPSGDGATLPIEYVEPSETNEDALGVDVAATPRATEALRRAGDDGQPIALVGIPSPVAASAPSVVPFVSPVYSGSRIPETVAERRGRLKGFAGATLRVGDMLAAALAELGRDGTSLCLLDVTDPAHRSLLYGESRTVDGGRTATSKTSRLAVGGRRWELSLALSPTYFASHRSWQSWSMLVGGLLFTAMLGAFLIVVTGRTVRVEEIVAQRTHELRRANEVLRRETARRITAQKIANIDPLTELLNRRGLEAELSKEIRRGHRTGEPIAALLVDLDDFKLINETLGHSVGDVVLKEVANRLRDSLRPTDHLARIGGDEFLILLPDTRMAEALHTAERLRLAVSDNPLRLASGPVRLTGSLGIERVPLGVASIEEVLTRTHLSLSQSKRTGKNRVSSRGARSTTAGPSMSLVVQALCSASSFRAVKQPIHTLADESIVGWEFLSRGPKGGFEMPGDFFRVALERNILTLVDLHCARACVEASRSLPPGSNSHVNLLPSTILSTPEQRLVELFSPPGGGGRYCVEISEQQFIGDPACLRGPVRALKRAGLQVAIDDVGFGRSSLETLIVLEPDVVKIDQRMVKGVSRDRGKEQLLRRLVKVVGAMGSELVAEGIESREDLALLVDVGVPRGQGFLWGRPE